jgi:hypothetical protein
VGKIKDEAKGEAGWRFEARGLRSKWKSEASDLERPTSNSFPPSTRAFLLRCSLARKERRIKKGEEGNYFMD